MKKLIKYDCGPALANTIVELYAFDNMDKSSLAEVAKLREEPQPYGKGTGVTSFKAWEKDRSQPIRIFVNTNRDDVLSAVFRTIPHELDHLIGCLAESFKVDSGSEPLAYLCGDITSEFQHAMIKELGYCFVKA